MMCFLGSYLGRVKSDITDPAQIHLQFVNQDLSPLARDLDMLGGDSLCDYTTTHAEPPHPSVQANKLLSETWALQPSAASIRAAQ